MLPTPATEGLDAPRLRTRAHRRNGGLQKHARVEPLRARFGEE